MTSRINVASHFIAFTCGWLCLALTAAPPDGQIQIATVLAERCLACHGPDKQEGGYRVDSLQRMRMPGDSGLKPIEAGSPAHSELFQRLTTDNPDLRMPAEAAPLPAAQVAAFEKWIADGAKAEPEYESLAITAWARPVKRKSPPEHYPTSLPITAIALKSVESEVAVWTSGYGEVLQWKLSASQPSLSRRIATAGAHVSDIDLSTDGRQLAVASGTPGTQGFVELFSLANENAELTWSHVCPDLPADLAFAPGQNMLAVGLGDGTLLVATFDAAPATAATHLLAPHADAILAVGWSAKADRLITGSRDRTAKIFDTSNWQLIANYDRHERAVGGVAYLDRHPVSLDETGKLRLWSGDDSDRTVAERDNQARFLERIVPVGKQIWYAMGADVRGLEVERQTVDDGTDDEGKPKQKTTTRWKISEELSSSSPAWLLSLAADASMLAVGSEAGEVIVWRTGEKQPWQRFMAKP